MKKITTRFWMFLLTLFLITSLLPMSALAASASLDVKPSGATVTKSSFGLTATGTSTLTVTYNGKKIRNSKAEFKSSKPRVATVSKNGVISTKTFGKTTIYVKYKGKTKKLSLTVSMPDTKIKTDGKTLDSRKLEVKPGSKTQLSLSLGYRNSGAKKTTFKSINVKKIRWKSDKKSVATVSSTGLVTAKKTGTTVITMYYGCVIEKVTLKVVKNHVSQKPQDIKEEDKDIQDTPAVCTHTWEAQYKTVAVPPIIKEEDNWCLFHTENDDVVIMEKIYYVCSCGKIFNSSNLTDFNAAGEENYQACKAHVAEMLAKGEYHTYEPFVSGRKQEHLYTLYRCACGESFIDNIEEYENHAYDRDVLHPDGQNHNCSSSEVYEMNTHAYDTVHLTYIETPASTKKELTGYECPNCGATKSN